MKIPKLAKTAKPTSAYIKKYPKISDTMDDLDKYDPVEESDAFNKQLSEIMVSTSTILRDPVLDVRELPFAANYLEWISGPKFLGFKPFSRQVDIGLQLHGDVCPRCSPEFYEKDVNYKWHHSEYRKRFSLFQFGVCPDCGMTREKAVRKGLMSDVTTHIGIAGQRCITGDSLVVTSAGILSIIDIVERNTRELCPSKAIYCQSAMYYVPDYRNSFVDFVADISLCLEDGTLVKPSRLYTTDIEFTYKVVTKYGFEIEGTLDHPICTRYRHPPEFTKLKDLNVGDTTYICLGTNKWGSKAVDPITIKRIDDALMEKINAMPPNSMPQSEWFTPAGLSQEVLTESENLRGSYMGYNNQNDLLYIAIPPLLEADRKSVCAALSKLFEYLCLCTTDSYVGDTIKLVLQADCLVSGPLATNRLAANRRHLRAIQTLLANLGVLSSLSTSVNAVTLYVNASETELFDKACSGEVLPLRMVPVAITRMILDKQQTYDFEVPEQHRFVANGILNHNSSKCLRHDTLVATPAGPMPVSHLHEHSKVRLTYGDMLVATVRQKRDFTYKITTSHGIPIYATRNHRLLTNEGYLHVFLKPAMRPVNHYLVVQKLPKLIPVHTPADSKYRQQARQDVSNYLNKPSNLASIWERPYAYKAEFLRRLLMREMYQDASRFQFKAFNEDVYVALRMWLEAHGIATEPATITVVGYDLHPLLFEVDVKAFLKHGPDVGMSRELRKHYWRSARKPSLPPVPGRCLSAVANLLRQVMTNHDRFKTLHQTRILLPGDDVMPGWRPQFTANDVKDLLKFGKHAEIREMALYSIFNICNSKSALSRERVKQTLRELRPWQNLAWNPKEKSDYDTLVELLREMITTRYAKILKITRSDERSAVYDISVPEHHWYVANGYHSHNSVLTGHDIGYTVQRAIRTGDPAGYYNLLPGSVLTCLLTSTSVNQAEKNLYVPIKNMMTMMPWFKTYAQWAKEKSNRMGIELFRIRDTYIMFRASGIDIRIIAPDKNRSRGFTSLGLVIDEIGLFYEDAAKRLASGSEMWTSMTNSMLTVKSAAHHLRSIGENDVVFPIAHAVSSPLAWTDPIMTLHKQYKDDPETFTYILPTWQFNPYLTKEMCYRLNPENYMRDFGCEPASASGTFITKPEALAALCTERRNAIKVWPEFYISNADVKYTIGKLKFRWKAAEGTVCGLALDASANHDQYAFTVFHIEDISLEEEAEDADAEANAEDSADNPASAKADVNSDDGPDIDDDDDYDDDEDDDDESLDNYRLVIDAIGCVQPSKAAPIHFTQMIKHIMLPLIEKFNVRVVVSDRWQSLQTQQDLEDDMEIESVMITPKLKDFLAFREAVYDQSIILPSLEVDIQDVIDLQHLEDFAKAPVALLIKQCLTVQEALKTVEKGAFSDDLFRTVILAHMCLRDEELRESLLSDMEPETEGPVSTVAGMSSDYLRPDNRAASSVIVFSDPSKKALVSNKVDPNTIFEAETAEEKAKAPVSFALTSRK